ncbi:MAG TPA: RICIN domain-containing protein [Verrucomicrobiae bacterium]|jgi:hypothetical protein|nr:RICIN domain-containing protein [Verrucomicrobiae bacterium]
MKKMMIWAVVFCAVTLFSVAGEISAPRSYQIRNCKFGDVLRPEDANSANGTHIVLYPAQPWKCMTWKLLPAGDSAFQLQNHFTHKTFAEGTNGTAGAMVQIPFESDASKRPAWKLMKLANGFYRMVDVASGRSLTAVSKDSVILTPWEDKPKQQWELMETDPATLTM